MLSGSEIKKQQAKTSSNVMDIPAYWQEYPDRDIEYVRWYPCVVGSLSEEKVWKKKPLSFYCHIPFCNNDCLDCLYNKFNTQTDLINKYIDALKKEIIKYSSRPYIQDREIIAGYFGGGIPAVLKTEQFKDLLVFFFRQLKIRKNAHITVETTPLDIDEEKAKMLLENGVSRVRLGIQSFNNELLKRIGLAQTGKNVKEVIAMLRKVGFMKIDVNIIYGLPGENMKMWEGSVERLLSLPITSVSLYLYTVNTSSPIYTKIVDETIPPCPTAEIADEMYNYAVRKLLSSGYVAVTTVDFAKISSDEREVSLYDLGTELYKGATITSVHGLAYPAHMWYECKETLAVGSGAYGYIKNHTYLNDPDVNEYIRKVNNGELPIVRGALVLAKERMAMSLVYGTNLLRILRKDFKDRHGIDMTLVFGKQIKQLEEQGLVKLTEEALEVTYPKGWRYMDNISKAFYTDLNYKMP